MKLCVCLVAILTAFIILPVACHACLNDRDTLAEEVQGLPDVVQVITGRFERNPPLFYQMRIQRVTKELQSHPSLLSDYDDIGVAYDRLGRDDEALAWLAKKRRQLPAYNADNPTLKEQWYRYYANIGTCRVHRWIRAGADRTKIAEVQQARDEIAHALAIKPNAHFGREKYQLQVMNWIIRPSTAETQQDAYRRMMSLFSLGRSRQEENWNLLTTAVYQAMHHPERLSLYDQAALSIFRDQRGVYETNGSLGTGTYWMAMKHKRLMLVDPLMKTQRQQWQSYFFIDADIHIYNWLWSRSDSNIYSQKDARQHYPEIQTAQTELVQALQIASGNDSNTIKQQLKAIHWIQQQQLPSPVFDSTWEIPASLSDYLRVGYRKNLEAVKALSGLIVLGNAWESPDIFDALSRTLLGDFNHHDRIGELAALRCKELINQGHPSLVSGAPFSFRHQMTVSPEEQAGYNRLRTEAEQWQKTRTNYMMVRLHTGRHPDTDPTFWNDYHDAGPPRLPIPVTDQLYLSLGKRLGINEYLWAFLIIVTPLLVISCLLYVLLRLGLTRLYRRAARTSSDETAHRL